MQQMQQQQMQSNENMKNAEMELEKYRIDTEASTKIQQAEIMVYSRQTEWDLNNNGVPDPMEIANLSLEQQKEASKKETEDRRLILLEKIATIKADAEKYKADKTVEATRISKSAKEKKK